MATGISTEKISDVKVALLDYTERVNALKNTLDDIYQSVNSNMSGAGKNEILNKIKSINSNFAKVNKVISSYDRALSSVKSAYESQDKEISSTVIKDIKRLDDIK